MNISVGNFLFLAKNYSNTRFLLVSIFVITVEASGKNNNLNWYIEISSILDYDVRYNYII